MLILGLDKISMELSVFPILGSPASFIIYWFT